MLNSLLSSLALSFQLTCPARCFANGRASRTSTRCASTSPCARDAGTISKVPITAGAFVAEAMSVLIQRAWFKVTKRRYGEGRRVFRMAPLHHHFELIGWKETTVVARFWILSIMCAFLGIATLKLR